MKHGFIGYGNIAQALHQGLRQEEGHKFAYVWHSTDHDHILTRKGLGDLVTWADVIWLGVKPQVIGELMEEIAKGDLENTVLVSPIAGKKLAYFRDYVGEQVPVVRIMPNLALAYQQSVTSFISNMPEERGVQNVRGLLQNMGEVVDVAEKDFDMFTALFGSSPAFILKLVQVFEEKMQGMGIAQERTPQLLARLFAGTLAYYTENTGLDTGTLIDKVASKGGVTEVGLRYMDERTIQNLWGETLEVAAERSREMSS